MNTSAVAKLLGVSTRSVQRWVKHLGLEMKRNEFGHYLYTDEDVRLLKEFKKQIQNGVPLQDNPVQKKARMGTMKLRRNNKLEENLPDKIRELERKIETKADSVVSYQLLQHRKELEELRTEIEKLNEQIDFLKANSFKTTEIAATSETTEGVMTKRKKKTVFRSLFGH